MGAYCCLYEILELVGSQCCVLFYFNFFRVILKLCYNSLHKTNLSCRLILFTNFDFDGPMFCTHNTISGETSRGEV